MKTNHTILHQKKIIYHPKYKPFPNAAEGHYYWSKILDYALAAATSLGTVTILFFFMTLS